MSRTIVRTDSPADGEAGCQRARRPGECIRYAGSRAVAGWGFVDMYAGRTAHFGIVHLVLHLPWPQHGRGVARPPDADGRHPERAGQMQQQSIDT